MKTINSVIISAFPGTGKSYFANLYPTICSDSDSSSFSWIEKDGEKKRNPNFPRNYFDYILNELVGKKKIIFVSSHESVRQYMVDNNIYFNLIYPYIDYKILYEYIDRFKKRGSDKKFINFIEENWYDFIADLRRQNCCNHIVLFKEEYISDYMGIFTAFTSGDINRLFIDINGNLITSFGDVK